MAVAGGFVVWVYLLGLGGGMGLPLGVPPLPEEAVLARVAPEECLFYTSWAGTATPDPKSPNQGEQLLAEPEVQHFVTEIERRVKASLVEMGRREGPQSGAASAKAAVVNEAIDWVKLLLTRPAALYVADVKLTPVGPPELRAGLVVVAGDNAAALKASIEKQQAAVLGSAAEAVKIDGETWYRIKGAAGPASLTWGVKDKRLFVALGDGEAEAMLQRVRGNAPAWLTGIRVQLPVERAGTLSYLNLKKIIDTFAPMGGPQVRTVIDAVGLGNVKYLAGVTGLDRTGFVSRTLLAIDGEPQGLLALAAEKPLTPADLAPIPRDASIALAFRLSPERAFDTILSVAGKIDPRAPEKISRHVEEMDRQLGVNLRDDVLRALGDTWCVYNSPSEGGVVFTGLTAVVQLKDSQRLAAAHKKLVDILQAELDRGAPGARRSPKLEKFTFAGKDVYFFNARDSEFPFAPAWCITDKQLVVALFPQNVKAYLSRDTSRFESLARVPEVGGMFTADGGPVKLFYNDTPRLFELAYPFVPMLAQMAAAQMQREGVNLDVSIVPSAKAIGRHLRPGVTAVRRTKAGIEVVSRQSLPGGGMGTAPVAAALLLPAVQSAREAARRAQSMNNLKQIGLAMHNVHNLSKKFPPAYTTDKDGKPLLSWRVLILPYLEEDKLYEQFHLDEPWDSEHNKKLIAQMPAVYRDPNGPGTPGVTNYLTVRGKDTVFPGKTGISFADIRDGTSFTIMTVEVNNQKAVVWTGPDDLEYDEKNPLAGLVGLRPGGFIAGFADGSVVIPETIKPETLKALFTRGGGEVIRPGDY